MLVLTRKLDEAIRISDDIKITVLRVKGNTVRIGIEAPRDVRIVRDELEPESNSTGATARTNKRTRTTALASLQECGSEAGSNETVCEDSAGSAPLQCEERLGSDEEDGAVVATVVDSPQPSTSRLFVGRVRVDRKTCLSEQDGGDQAAPLRAFLRRGARLQAAG